jgi:hypothetical protein
MRSPDEQLCYGEFHDQLLTAETYTLRSSKFISPSAAHTCRRALRLPRPGAESYAAVVFLIEGTCTCVALELPPPPPSQWLRPPTLSPVALKHCPLVYITLD